MKVAIYSRGQERDLSNELMELITELDKNKVQAVLHQSIGELVPQHMQSRFQYFDSSEDLNSSYDFLLSLGGDGTILDSVTLVKDKNIPIVGINFGRLGYLAGIQKNEIPAAIEALASGVFANDKRTLIHLDGNKPLFGDAPFGLNEFAILKKDVSPMVKIHTYLNGEFLNTYWCDGLIVSTATGSTGYNLSCNGPIISPDSASFIITPVAPHHLNVRPIVVPDHYIISFEVESRSDEFICSLDSRREIINTQTQLAVKKEEFKINLVRLVENNFLSTLRSKLVWGLDRRN